MSLQPAPEYASARETALNFHGHACPGLALGCRIAVDALACLAHARSVDEELVCVAETESCALDAIQAVAGCSLGKGNLILRLRGKHAFSFFLRDSGKSLRFLWTASAGNGSREETMSRFLSAPAGDLYRMLTPAYGLPPKAAVSPSIPCAACGENVSECSIRLHQGRYLCLDCYDPHSRIIL